LDGKGRVGRKPRISRRRVFYLGGLRTTSAAGLRLRGTVKAMGLRIPRGCAIAEPDWLVLESTWSLYRRQVSL
jgi:hypothetical protein